MKRNRAARVEKCRYSSQAELPDDTNSIEVQIEQENSMTLQRQNRFQESHSSDRLLPPGNATPNDSLSSSGCKYFKRECLTNNKIMFLILVILQ